MGQGLTGGKEECRLLVGKKPRFTLTKGTSEKPPRVRVVFEGAFGINDPDNLKFCCWRRCIAYGQYAEEMKKADVGSLVLVKGWISSEAKKDENGKPIIENGNIVKVETIVCTGVDGYLEVLMRDKVQKNENQLRFGENGENQVSQVEQTV